MSITSEYFLTNHLTIKPKFMRKITSILMIALLSVFAISCEEDEEISVAGNKYETTYAKIVWSMGEETETIELKTKAELEEEELYVIVEFKSDGTFWAGGEESGTWTETSSTIVTTEDYDGEIIESTLTKDGSDLKYEESETEDDYSSSLILVFSKM